MTTTPNAGTPGNLAHSAYDLTQPPTPAELADLNAALSAVVARHGRERLLRWAHHTLVAEGPQTTDAGRWAGVVAALAAVTEGALQ